MGPLVKPTHWVRLGQPHWSSPTGLTRSSPRTRLTLTLSRLPRLPRRLRHRRSIPANSGCLGPRHGSQSTRLSMAHPPVHVDLETTTSPAHPRPLLQLSCGRPLRYASIRRPRSSWCCSAALVAVLVAAVLGQCLAWPRLGTVVAWSVPPWSPWLHPRASAPRYTFLFLLFYSSSSPSSGCNGILLLGVLDLPVHQHLLHSG
jgi:hypothetical protein